MAAPLVTPPGRRLPPGARREQLLRLAADRFAAQTYEDVSIEALAHAAGVSRGLLYHYFPSKRDLYVATIEVTAADLLSATEPPADLDPVAGLRHSLEAYLRHVERHAPGYAAIVRGGLGGADGEVLAIAARVRDELTRRLVEALSGPRPSKALRLAVRGWQGYCEAVALEWVEHRPVSRARAVALMMTALEATLGAVDEPGAGAG